MQSLNLLGLIDQGSGLHAAAIKMFAKAIIADALDAACHYNIAVSYQAREQHDKAAFHFKQAIALGMSEKDVEKFIAEVPAIGACRVRLEKTWPLPLSDADLFGATGLATIAKDLFLQCALELVLISEPLFESLLTQVRSAMLGTMRTAATGDEFVGLFSALAQQCFINEYVYAQDESESRQAESLRDQLLKKLTDGSDIPPLLLAAVAAYAPLHMLPTAEKLLAREWPKSMSGLLRQQLGEPREEARDRDAIPALTPIDDSVSLQVMRQYEENPYPRWTVCPLGVLSGERKLRGTKATVAAHVGEDVLIAGCGTGKHPVEIALCMPGARILAVDISRASIAYARRKTREEGLTDIEYAQADILKLGAVDRSFDRIECVGVLHHIADPRAGLRVILSLLRPDGELCIGLYSDAARRDIAWARALIVERGYRLTPQDIRRFRQDILRGDIGEHRTALISSADFHSMSGCRDLLFNVVEHRFTIPQIKAILDDEKLTFLGFDCDHDMIEKFQTCFPDAPLTDIDRWHDYETENPQTFRAMYVFWVRKLSGRDAG